MVAQIEDSEKLETLSKVCRRRLDKSLAPSTYWRWRTKGVTVNGIVIKLRCTRVGGEWRTTASAFEEFLRAQTEAALGPQPMESERTEATERRLATAGLK